MLALIRLREVIIHDRGFKMSENDLLEERIKNLKENVDKLEDDQKETKREFMEALELLRIDFLKARDDLIARITGFLSKALITVTAILGSAVIGLAIYIILNLKP
jgi:hypothetical protein